MSDVQDVLAQTIRVGFVTARQPETMRVQVELRDTVTQPLSSAWLPVLCPRASGDLAYDLPDVGDQVLCLFLPYGLEQGRAQAHGPGAGRCGRKGHRQRAGRGHR